MSYDREQRIEFSVSCPAGEVFRYRLKHREPYRALTRGYVVVNGPDERERLATTGEVGASRPGIALGVTGGPRSAPSKATVRFGAETTRRPHGVSLRACARSSKPRSARLARTSVQVRASAVRT